MTLIDTHAHLYWESFKEDFDQILQRSLDTGVSTIINVGVDVEKSQVALEQARNTNWPEGLSVYSTIGIHPEGALKYESSEILQKDIEELEKIYLSDPAKVIAIGECGLDFSQNNNNNGYNDYNYHNFQKKLFEAQINLAQKLRLPLVVHCRDDRSKNPQNSECWDEVLKMVGDYKTILHCYSGLSHTTRYILQTTNLFVSFAANITYPKNEYLREAVKTLPLDKILLETDSPFLSPQSKRGQRNEPSSVLEIAQMIADLKGISLEEVAAQTTKNAKKIIIDSLSYL